MAYCRYNDDFLPFDVTPVSNIFLMEYMPRAGGDYVRVYLYGLMLCRYADAEASVESTARALGMRPDEVTQAFSYWESQGLVVRMSDNPPSYCYLHPSRSIVNRNADPMNGAYRYRDFFHSLQTICRDKMLAPKEHAMAVDWVESMHLPEDVVLFMVESEVDKRRRNKRSLNSLFRDLDKTAMAWSDQGINTVAAAEELLLHESAAGEAAKAVLRRMGTRRAPTIDEIEMAAGWLDELKMTKAQIEDSCKVFTRATSPSFAYLDTALRSQSLPYREEIIAAAKALGASGLPTKAQSDTYARLLGEGFDNAAILYAAGQCSTQGKRTFEDLEHKLEAWKRSGIFTKEAAEEFARRREPAERMIARVTDVIGPGLTASPADIAQMDEWLSIFPQDMILLAASRSRGRLQSVSYMRKILASWQEKGIRDIAAAEQEARDFEKTPRQTNATPAAPKTVTAQQYEQRSYSSDPLERIAVDFTKLPGEET